MKHEFPNKVFIAKIYSAMKEIVWNWNQFDGLELLLITNTNQNSKSEIAASFMMANCYPSISTTLCMTQIGINPNQLWCCMVRLISSPSSASHPKRYMACTRTVPKWITKEAHFEPQCAVLRPAAASANWEFAAWNRRTTRPDELHSVSLHYVQISISLVSSYSRGRVESQTHRIKISSAREDVCGRKQIPK
jgi:hypothetical protein